MQKFDSFQAAGNFLKKDTFSTWVRDELPKPNECHIVLDGGYFIYNHKTNEMIILEVKTKSKDIKPYQKRFYDEILVPALKTGLDTKWFFYGFHVLKFSNTMFSNSDLVTFDGEEITEQEVKLLLSFDMETIRQFIKE